MLESLCNIDCSHQNIRVVDSGGVIVKPRWRYSSTSIFLGCYCVLVLMVLCTKQGEHIPWLVFNNHEDNFQSCMVSSISSTSVLLESYKKKWAWLLFILNKCLNLRSFFFSTYILLNNILSITVHGLWYQNMLCWFS